MGRKYTASIKTASITGPKTLMLLQVPADAVIKLLSADVVAPDDDTNEQLDLVIQTVNVLGSPVGTSVTPSKHSNGDAASGITATGDLTTEPTSYAASTEVARMGAASLSGYHWRPAEDERPEYSPSQSLGLRLLTAIASKALSVNVVFEELGG